MFRFESMRATYLGKALKRLRSGPDVSDGFGKMNRIHREAWLEENLGALPPSHRILDAGAGEMRYRRFCEHLEYVSQDFAEYDGTGDGRGLQKEAWDQQGLDIVCDITEIPEPDASFDAIMCIEVLEHVPYPVDALKELTRLLRPTGILILTAPFCSLTHYAPYFYQTGYSRYFYEHWLGELGYDILDLQWNGSYFEWLAQELHRAPKIGEQYAGDRPSRRERKALKRVVNLMRRFDGKDQGSEQLLSYGLQVKARKKDPNVMDQSTHLG